MSQEFGLDRIGQVSVHVGDLERATAFYRDKLGMTDLFTAGHMAFFSCGEVRLMLTTHLSENGESSIIYYQVPDIHAAAGAMQSRGVAIDHAPHLIAKMSDHDLWMCFVKDSEGNTVGLMSEVRPPAR